MVRSISLQLGPGQDGAVSAFRQTRRLEVPAGTSYAGARKCQGVNECGSEAARIAATDGETVRYRRWAMARYSVGCLHVGKSEQPSHRNTFSSSAKPALSSSVRNDRSVNAHW